MLLSKTKMAIVLKLLTTAFELSLVAACVHSCLTLKKHVKTTCTAADAMRSSKDELVFEMTYDRPVCKDVWKDMWESIPACWVILLRGQEKPSNSCQNSWRPGDNCHTDLKIGCYAWDRNIIYLRHIVDKQFEELKMLSGGRFEVAVRRRRNPFQFVDRYFYGLFETIPVVFDLEIIRITLNDEELSLDTQSRTIMVDMYYDLEYCVFNLIKGDVRVDLAGSITRNRPKAPCVRVIFVASRYLNEKNLILSFVEKGGCKRPGQIFTIEMFVDMSSSMMTIEMEKKWPSSSSLPGIPWWSLLIGLLVGCSG